MKTIKLPDIGEGVKEGELKTWLVKEGDHVQVDDVLAEVLTDKAAVEVPSPHAGQIKSLKAKVGDAVPVGGALLELDLAATHAATTTEKSDAAPQKTSSQSGQPVRPASMNPPVGNPPVGNPPVGNPPVENPPVGNPPVGQPAQLATPATRRLAREMGVDLSHIQGTGLAGRITREDVLQSAEASPHGSNTQHSSSDALGRILDKGRGATSSPTTQMAGVGAGFSNPTPTGGGSDVGRSAPPPTWVSKAPVFVDEAAISPLPDSSEPLQGVRRKIAQHLQHTKQVVPHFTIYSEARVDKLISLRNDLRATHDPKMTYLPFVAKALARTLQRHPACNASIDDDKQQIIYKKNYHIGFACDTSHGLLVPVVRHADHKPVLQLSSEVLQLAERARAGKATRAQLQGATVSITNIGSVGGLMGTPIINHPEVLILGMYALVKRPVWHEMQWQPQHFMGFTVTCDHRLIDGAGAAKFLKDFVALIEHPASLLV